MLEKKLYWLDGAIGTFLEEKGMNLDSDVWTGKILTNDKGIKVLESVHRDYLNIGCDIITTCSYQIATSKPLKTFGIDVKEVEINGFKEEEVEELLKKSITVAKKVCREFKMKKLIACSLSCIGASIPFRIMKKAQEFCGDYVDFIKEKEIYNFHKKRIQYAIEAKADILLFETFPALKEARIICDYIKERYNKEIRFKSFPMVFFSFSFANENNTWNGDKIETIGKVLSKYKFVTSIGINCTSPKFVVKLVKKLKKNIEPTKMISCCPNSGEDYQDGVQFAWKGGKTGIDWQKLSPELFKAGCSIIGGCCRTNCSHIQKMKKGITELIF